MVAEIWKIRNFSYLGSIYKIYSTQRVQICSKIVVSVIVFEIIYINFFISGKIQNGGKNSEYKKIFREFISRVFSTQRVHNLLTIALSLNGFLR